MTTNIHWNIPTGLHLFYLQELGEYRSLFLQGYYQEAWRHLERAHILGQAYPIEHTVVHWKMLKFGFHIKNWGEVVGQFPRLLAGGVKSFVGKVPVGNSGGANVPPLQPMEIPEDLRILLDRFRK